MNDDKIIFQLIDSNINVEFDKQFSGSEVKDIVHKIYEYIYTNFKSLNLPSVISITIKIFWTINYIILILKIINFINLF